MLSCRPLMVNPRHGLLLSHGVLYRDILYQLAFVGNLPVPNSTPPSSNKLEQYADSPASTNTEVPMITIPSDIASSRHDVSSPTEHAGQSQQGSFYTLPAYSEELGRLPLHGEVAFSPDSHSDLDSTTIPSMSVSKTHSPPYSTSSTAGESSFSMDGPKFDFMSSNFTAFSPELFSSSRSSLGTTSESTLSNMGLHSTGFDLHQVHTVSGERIADLENAQEMRMMNSDVFAMWSNAPSGFEYVN
jgi:hypothetical protein